MFLEYCDKFTEILHETKILNGDDVVQGMSNFDNIVKLFMQVKESNKQLFFIGNGGSAAIASHMLTDFMKNGGMCTVNLMDGSLITCIGNDYGYEYVYAKPLSMMAHAGDLLVAISSSGNSPNIINAVKTGIDLGMKVITFTGFKEDNKICRMGDYNVYVPIEQYGIVESIHNLLLQYIVDVIARNDI